MAKLSTPQNVSISNNILSFDAVADATGYVIYAGGTEIGTYGAIHTYIVDIIPDSSLSVKFAPYAGETNSYDAVSGWTLYDGDQLTIIKTGSSRRLWINGEVYEADNTTHEITITNENIDIWTEEGSDPTGSNYAKVVITFKRVTSQIMLGSTQVTAAYLGSVKLPQAYLGAHPMLGLKGDDTYYIESDLTNVNYVDNAGQTVAAPTSILTDGEWITARIAAVDTSSYSNPTVAITPVGVVNYTYTAGSRAILNMRAPRGNFTITASATAITYNVTANGTNCTITGPSTIAKNGTATYTVTLEESIYELPDTVTVTGAVGNWNKATKTLVISSPTGPTTGNPYGDVTISIVATNIKYSFSESLTNCYTNDQERTFCYAGMTFFRTYKVKSTGYAFPTSITVTNATYEWTAGSGELKISNPTGPVTVTISAVAKTFNYRFTNNYCTVYDEAGTTQIVAGGTFKAGQTITFTIKPYDHYKLTSDSVSVTNATIDSWNASTGKITIKDPVMDDGTNTVMITTTAVVSEYAFTVTNINCTPTPTSGYVSTGSTETAVSFVPDDNFLMAESSFTVTNATKDVQIAGDGEIAVVRLSNATGTVSLKATANRVSYPLTLTGTHCTLTADKDYVSLSTATTRIKVVPDSDYKTNGPAGLVLGGINTYSTETVDGVFYILMSFATANASVKYTCVEDTVAIPAGTYQFKETIALANLPTPNVFSFDTLYNATMWYECKNMTVTTSALTSVRTAGNIAACDGSKWGGYVYPYIRINRLNSAQTVVRSFYNWFTANTYSSYNITVNATNCTYSGASSVDVYGTATITFAFDSSSYTLTANDITVTNATKSYNASTKVLTLSNVTGDVTVTAAANEIYYSVTENLTGVSVVGTHPTQLSALTSSIILQYSANSGYNLPTDITVSGASYSWAKDTGKLTLYNINGNIVITIVGARAAVTVTYNLTNCTAASTNPTTVNIGGSADFKFTASTGYELSATPTVTGATLASWDYPDVDDRKTMIAGIENVTGNVTITVVASQPKLATPTGLTIDGDTLSFNAVENAEQYEVFAGSNIIGTYTVPSKGYTVTISISSLNANVCFYSTDNGSTWIDGYVAGQSQLVLNNVEQIKFKGQYSSSGDCYAYISVPSLGVSIYATSSSGAKYSDNFVLTQDLTDVTFASGSD